MCLTPERHKGRLNGKHGAIRDLSDIQLLTNFCTIAGEVAAEQPPQQSWLQAAPVRKQRPEPARQAHSCHHRMRPCCSAFPARSIPGTHMSSEGRLQPLTAAFDSASRTLRALFGT